MPITPSKPNSGSVFTVKGKPAEYTGALNIDGTIYDVSVVPATYTRDGKESGFFKLTGTRRDGTETVNGGLFVNASKTTANKQPNFRGDLTVSQPNAKWRISVWDAFDKNNAAYLNFSLTPFTAYVKPDATQAA